MLTIEEAKNYLRVSSADDDALLESLIAAARHICLGVLRTDNEIELEASDAARLAVLYAVAYLYEHREDADHHSLNLTLRSLLFSDRGVDF